MNRNMLKHLYTIGLLAVLIPASPLHAQGLKAQIPPAEYNALVSLYQSTGGPGWKLRDGWLNPNALSWVGVTVSGAIESGTTVTQRGTVTAIFLEQNKLVGTIPSSIGNLTNLADLFLNGNQLAGTIPSSIGTLSHLIGLDLSFNKYAGAIPSFLANLSQLTSLDLGGNRFTGSIPTWIGNLSQLTELRLQQNQLSGVIPDSIGNLSQLSQYWLSFNKLTGSIPVSTGSLAQLTDLELDHNSLTGSIPASLGNLSQLFRLNLSNNQLSGGVPQLPAANPANNPIYDFSYNSLDVSPGSQSLANILALTGSNPLFFSPIYSPQLIAGDGLPAGPNIAAKALSAGVPAVDAAGDVAVRVVLSSTGGGSASTTEILLYSGSTVTVVASTGQTAPGAGGARFVKLGDPVLSGSGTLAFVGTLKAGPGVTAANATGVWLATSGSAALVVRAGQTAVTGTNFAVPVTFGSIKQIGAIDGGGLALLAGLSGHGVSTTALFSTDSGGTLDLLAYTGTSGELAVKNFSSFAPLAHVTGQSRTVDTVNGNVAISGTLDSPRVGSIAAYLSGSAGFEENFLTETGTAVSGLNGASFKALDEPAINSQGAVTFRATLSGTGVKATNSTAIYLITGSGGALIARTGQAAPGTSGSFASFDDPVINNKGDVAFIGTVKIGTATKSGIWSTPAGGTPSLVALQGPISQGTTMGNFASFSQLVLPDVGGAVFLANVSGQTPAAADGFALWPVWALSQELFTPPVQKGRSLFFRDASRTISAVDIFQDVPTALGQSRSFDARTGYLVYKVTFTDGTWAIYEVTQFEEDLVF